MAGGGESAGNRFGEIAVREGFATRSQVKECLEIQAKLRSYGVEPKKIGEILVEKGYLKAQDTLAILEVQKHSGVSRIETGSRAGSRAVQAATATDMGRGRGRDGRGRDGEEVLPTPEIPGYEIVGLLGRGGMGAVYRARQKSLDRTVALKVLPPRAAKDESFIRKFISEARTVAKLNHENIIAGIDVGEANGTYYFAMEHVEGESVAGLIERDGPIEEKRALEIAAQIAKALEHAHKHGLVHRDVKPQNILLAKNDLAKLCDLGLAKQMGGDDRGETAGIPLGTPHYLSPEQARGEADVDIRSDIYSLGASLYHMLSGSPPFDGDSPMVLMTKHLTEEPVSLRKRNPEVSKAAAELIEQMMSKDKDERHQSPTEVLEDIQRVLSGKKSTGGTAGLRREKGGSGGKRRRPGSATNRALERRGSVATEEEPRGRRTGRAVAVRDGPGRTDTTPLMIALIAGVIVTIVAVVFLAGGDPMAPSRPTLVMETEAENALVKADGAYQTARYNDAIAENRALLKDLFQKIVERYPNTAGAKKAAQRLDELGK